MDIGEITPRYYVAPQIDAKDLSELKAQGFTCVICNRPDEEVPPSHHAVAMEKAAKDAGLDFVINPLTHDTMTDDRLALQRATLEGAEGKVLAYCASGTRSTIVWALGQAGTMSSDEIVEAARAAGYQLDNIRPTLDAIAQS